MAGGFKSDTTCNGLQRQAGARKQWFGFFHPYPQNVFMQRLARSAPDPCLQLLLIDPYLLREEISGDPLRISLINVTKRIVYTGKVIPT